MNILLITGSLYPQPGNNANLVLKLVPYLQRDHTVHVLSPAFGAAVKQLPQEVHNIPMHWAPDSRRDLRRKFVYPLISKVVDPNGYSDALQMLILYREAKKLRTEFPYDAVITTMEPFPAACVGAYLPSSIKKILYLMDPPACTHGSAATKFRSSMLGRILGRQDQILTTPFIRQALKECGYGTHAENIAPVGFPMVDANRVGETQSRSSGKINLLFCGWLYSDIRSPRYFLDILSRLDERFCITFMGKECELLTQRFDIQTKAEIKTLPQQPYEVALQAMADADVLINIGNSVPVHMPSKTLEYINTGKPMVNFHKLPDCPTLYYTRRYPLCLNLYEGEADIDKAAEQFVRFCEERKGQTVDRLFIEQEYADCTPQYIAQQILDKLGDRND